MPVRTGKISHREGRITVKSCRKTSLQLNESNKDARIIGKHNEDGKPSRSRGRMGSSSDEEESAGARPIGERSAPPATSDMVADSHAEQQRIRRRALVDGRSHDTVALIECGIVQLFALSLLAVNRCQ